MLKRIEAIKHSHTANLMARHFDASYFNSLSQDDQDRLSQLIATGVENPDSQLGAYAMQPDDYDRFKPLLDRIIRDYHGIEGEICQISNWNITDTLNLEDIDPSFNDVSMRVRVGRNLAGVPLPGAMTRDDRVHFENTLVEALNTLIANPQFGGRYRSLTPGSAHQISQAEYQSLVDAHQMFKDMSADPYLTSAGISSDWPYGRGLYVSEDQQFIVWIGEEDHLRIMAMRRGSSLNALFERLHTSLNALEDTGLVFARSDTYGYVTSCPTNLGTGMRASLHVKLPRLSKDGTDVNAIKPHAKTLGLSVRGAGGEHTAPGEGGLVDLSPSARLMITEAQIAKRLYDGVAALWRLEQSTPIRTNPA